MRDIGVISHSEIENTLWEEGLNFHNLSRTQRKQILNEVSSKSKDLLNQDILNFVSYVLHSYFIQMDDVEKKILINMVVDRFGQAGSELGEGLELIAIMLKGCPNDYRSKLVDLITKQRINEDTNPSKVISYTNAIRYVFDEIGVEDQRMLYMSLMSLQQITRYEYLKPTIQYTISNIKSLLKP